LCEGILEPGIQESDRYRTMDMGQRSSERWRYVPTILQGRSHAVSGFAAGLNTTSGCGEFSLGQGVAKERFTLTNKQTCWRSHFNFLNDELNAYHLTRTGTDTVKVKLSKVVEDTGETPLKQVRSQGL